MDTRYVHMYMHTCGALYARLPAFRRGAARLGSAELKPFYQKWQHVIAAVILGFETLIYSCSRSLSLFLPESVHVTRARLSVFIQCGRK